MRENGTDPWRESLDRLCRGYEAFSLGSARLIRADCFEWLSQIPSNCLHAIVTDPPYGVKEYRPEQLLKREQGKGGIWRIPPSFDGHRRAPLPRFTALSPREREALETFFREWGKLACRALRPGGHLFLASNAFLSQLVFSALVDAGLEFRGEVVRLVRTLRGGDRPKNAEEEFPDVCSLPRGCYEPWGILRKPLPRGLRVSDCLRQYGTGGLRRLPDGRPFEDVIPDHRTPAVERQLAPHPSLKPQSFLRRIVYTALPLGEGILVDPFMGSGSTVAAALALGIACIGVEWDADYHRASLKAVPSLARVVVADPGPDWNS